MTVSVAVGVKARRARVLMQVIVTLALFALGTTPALAQSSPAGFVCGKVTSYTAPKAATDGSIGIGTTTFVLRAGSIPPGNTPPPVAVGSVTCVDGRRDASGAFTSFGITLTGDAQICGPVTTFTPASATARGSITIATGQISPTLPVRVGANLSSVQTTGSQCFQWAVSSADGNAEVVSYVGPFAIAPAPNQLPNTSTSGSDRTATADGQIDVCGSLSYFSPGTATQNNRLGLSTAGRIVDYQLVITGTYPPDLGARSTTFSPEIVRLVGRPVEGANFVADYAVTRVASCNGLPNTSTAPKGDPVSWAVALSFVLAVLGLLPLLRAVHR